MTTKNKVNINITGLSRNLVNAFQIACILQDTPMQEKVKSFLNRKPKNRKLDIPNGESVLNVLNVSPTQKDKFLNECKALGLSMQSQLREMILDEVLKSKTKFKGFDDICKTFGI